MLATSPPAEPLLWAVGLNKRIKPPGGAFYFSGKNNTIFMVWI